MVIRIDVYGTEISCASCVNLPSGKDTTEWLETLLDRKYPNTLFEVNYIDFENPKGLDNETILFCEKIKEDDMIYPIVKINGKLRFEGQVLVTRLYQLINQLIEENEYC